MHRAKARKLGTTAFLILLALLVVRGALFILLAAFGLSGEPLLGPPADRFADCLKVALAQVAVIAPLQHDPAVAAWPGLARHYLLHNDYLGPGATVQHLPPFSTVLFMGIAKLFHWMPPGAIIGLMVCAYGAASLALARAIEGLTGEHVLLPAFALIFLSYPSLFMIDRGNFHSGATSLLVTFYTFTALFGRWRWAGWLALALAVSIRPNVALFALLEFGRDRSLRQVAAAAVAIGAMTLFSSIGSLLLATWIDPTYSLASFVRSYAWYDANYVKGVQGMAWNMSLPNVAKLAYAVLGYRDVYDPIVAAGLTLLGGCASLLFLALHLLQKIRGEQFVFALTAICAVFTPVFAEYHALIFVAPLLLLIGKRPQPIRLWALLRGAGLLAALQALCLVFDVLGASILLLYVALLSLAFPLLAGRLSGAATKEGESMFVIALASMAALSPLGGGISNGLAVALLLASTLAWIAVRSLSRERRSLPERSDDPMRGAAAN